jgi:integrase/recombinase XerC
VAGTYKAGTDVVDGTRLGAPQLSQAVDECKVALASGWVSTGQAKRVGLILERFVAFTSLGFNVGTIDAVTPAIAGAFVSAAGPGGNAPTIALMHLRRTALRLLFRSARSGGVDVGDPTLDLVLPPRSPLSTRPLTDDEVVLCRSHAFWSLTDSRRAAAWALAEATCRSSELAHVIGADIDLLQQRVWIHGGRTTAERWGHLTDWGAIQVRRRVGELGNDPSRRLVYAGKSGGESGQASSCLAILDVLTRSGLATEPDVRPASVAGWAGRQILAETGRIDEVARRLGMASLDRTARFIAWDWQHPDDSDEL